MNPTKNNCSTIAVLYLFLSIAITLLMAQTPFSKSAQAAPPTNYEGFGSVTRGALDAPGGYETYHVTKLDDDGSPGTLRDALSVYESTGSRYIVFDVGGTITLTSSLPIRHSYITIDGFSAPSPGITIDQGKYTTEIEPWSGGEAHDIIIHHLRMVGPGYAKGGDILGLNGMHAHIYNVIFDHITTTASGDGTFDTIVNVNDVTLSWNFIHDTELCTLIKYGGIEGISLHHNVYAKNAERQALVGQDIQLMDYVNNVVYGWDFQGGLRIQYNAGVPNPNLNVENNVFHLWENGFYDMPEHAIHFDGGQDAGSVYFFNGNIIPVGETDAVSTGPRLPIPSYAQVTMYDASTLGDTVVPFAGTHYPTQEEQDLLNEVSIAIGGQAAPIANAGPDQTVTDEDSDGSEQVTLDGSASRDPDGTIVSFIWSEESSQIATGINPTVTLSTGTHLITLTVTDNGGSTDTNTVTIKVLEGDKEFAELPAGCYNNVFNPAKGEKALIVVELPKQAHVRLNLYNTRGNKIRELADEQKEAGTHKYYWDGKSGNGDVVGSGLYFVHIQAGDYKKTKKIVVVK